MLRIVQKKCVETQITSKIHLKYSQTWALRPRQNSLKKCGDEQVKLPNSSTEAKFHKQQQTMTKFATYTKKKNDSTWNSRKQSETVGADSSLGKLSTHQSQHMDKLSENPAKPAKLKKETKVNVNQLETVGCGFSGGRISFVFTLCWLQISW